MFMKSIFIITRFVFLISVLLLLGGCNTFTPHYFGISDAEWSKFDKNKQHELQDVYYQQIKAKKSIEKKEISPSDKKIFSDAKSIDVYVYGGTAMMPPFTSSLSYASSHFTIAPNSCSDAELKWDSEQQPKDPKKQKVVVLTACYKKGILLLDPSRYEHDKTEGTLRIHYSPIWEQGLTYKDINTSGYVRLKNANITVKFAD